MTRTEATTAAGAIGSSPQCPRSCPAFRPFLTRTRLALGYQLASAPLHRLPGPLWDWVGAPLFRLGMRLARISVG